MRKVGETFFHGNLEYIVDEINADGSCNAHLIKVHGIEYATEIDAIEAVSDTADTPVEEKKEVEPKPTTPEKKTTATRAKSTTSTRKKTTTKKTTAKK